MLHMLESLLCARPLLEAVTWLIIMSYSEDPTTSPWVLNQIRSRDTLTVFRLWCTEVSKRGWSVQAAQRERGILGRLFHSSMKNIWRYWSNFRWFVANPNWCWDKQGTDSDTEDKDSVTHKVNEVYLFTFWSWRPHGALWSLMALQRQTQEIMLCEMIRQMQTTIPAYLMLHVHPHADTYL